MFGALGVDMPTAVSNAVLDEALSGAKGAKRLELNTLVEGCVLKGCAAFYRVTVSEEESARGIALRAWASTKNDRLKLLLFDSDMELLWQVNGMPQRLGGGSKLPKFNMAEMILAGFDTVTLGKPSPDFMLENPDDALFHKLDKLERPPLMTLPPGDHLFAVYGDNFMSRLKFTLQTVVLEPDSELCQGLQEQDVALRTKQQTLTALEKEYKAAQKAYEAAAAKCKEEEEAVQELLQGRAALHGKIFGVEPVKEPPRQKGKKKEGCAHQ